MLNNALILSDCLIHPEIVTAVCAYFYALYLNPWTIQGINVNIYVES